MVLRLEDKFPFRTASLQGSSDSFWKSLGFMPWVCLKRLKTGWSRLVPIRLLICYCKPWNPLWTCCLDGNAPMARFLLVAAITQFQRNATFPPSVYTSTTPQRLGGQPVRPHFDQWLSLKVTCPRIWDTWRRDIPNTWENWQQKILLITPHRGPRETSDIVLNESASRARLARYRIAGWLQD